MTIDKRDQQQAHIFGYLIFIDESELHFREFIDASEGSIDKLAYSYHLQDKNNNLLFRYDNAKHKPACNYSVPLFNKEGLGEILLDKSPSTPLFQRGESIARGLNTCLSFAFKN